MSRQLPARPNLEHLRKQAKALLDDLQRTDPSTQLANAQHALAQQYGFASWPKLKADVERQSRRPAQTRSPFVGRWTANPGRSTPHPANPWRTATIVFEVHGDNVKITDVVVDASGREERHVNAIQADGIEHASGSGDGYSLLSRWRDPHTLEAIGKKDGHAVGAALYQVSVDGRTLTISGDQQLVVLDRSSDSSIPGEPK